MAVPDKPAVGHCRSWWRKARYLIADIHFNYRLALQALEARVQRINPGNIGGRERFREVIKAASDRGAALRLGVNAGSLDRSLLTRYGAATPEALVESALGYLRVVAEENFHNVVVSLKASDVLTTVGAYRKISPLIDYPLHLG